MDQMLFKVHFIFLGYDIGCVKDTRFDKFTNWTKKMEEAISVLKDQEMRMNKWMQAIGWRQTKNPNTKTGWELLMVREVLVEHLMKAFPDRYGWIGETPWLASALKTEGMYKVDCGRTPGEGGNSPNHVLHITVLPAGVHHLENAPFGGKIHAYRSGRSDCILQNF